MDAIKTESLTKYYGRSRGIVELDLSVGEGEYFGFIGPNGAGKSTTIRTLLGLIYPTSGRAEVFGRDVSKDKTAILSDVGYLPSEALFYPGMKVKEVLKLSSDLRGKNCTKRADELCERLKLDASEKIDSLSFGNRKKVAIVAALQSDPRLLILDEPTGGLDPLMQREFFDIVGERNRDGVTVFLSSHVLPEVQRNCRRAAVIRDGRIIACDSVESLARTNTKRVTVHGTVNLEGLDGIKDLKVSGEDVSFLYGGKTDLLLKRLCEGDVRDLGISEPELDEIFLHYYEKGDDGE